SSWPGNVWPAGPSPGPSRQAPTTAVAFARFPWSIKPLARDVFPQGPREPDDGLSHTADLPVGTVARSQQPAAGIARPARFPARPRARLGPVSLHGPGAEAC